MFSVAFLGGILFVFLFVISIFCAMAWRIVVPTNAVHIVQSGRKTTPYGAGQSKNIYYAWPSWVPRFGVKVSVLPLSVFRVELEEYAAYDKGRLPFMLDVLAFFRISDPAKAAERISSINELDGQLQGIMQGVVRTILANAEIEDILGKRAEFSDMFTHEIREQLPQWGIEAVKNIELMDIRDAPNNQVISNIMAKKKSEIEKESRVAVADNMREAKSKEIDANQAVSIRQQDSEEAVGIRTAAKNQKIGIETQKAEQAVAVEAAMTATKNMAVQEVKSVRAAEIAKQVQIVQAQQNKEVALVAADAEAGRAVKEAEGAAQATIRTAEGSKQSKILNADGIRAEGEAQGAAETARQLATVTPQITLAKEIGTNVGYQQYLINIKLADVMQATGIESAKALQHGEVKVIVNSDSPNNGMKSIMDLFSGAGGAKLGAMLETLGNVSEGAKKVIDGNVTPKK